MSQETYIDDVTYDNTKDCENVCESRNLKTDNTLVSEDGTNSKKIAKTQKNEDINLYIAESKTYNNKYKIDVGTYLRSEFTAVIDPDSNGKLNLPSKLPECKEINLVDNKHGKAGRKKPNVYSENAVVVQFMGSENMPENKVQMIYEPESRNYTVKTMFAMLLLMHLFITLGIILYVGCDTDHGIMWYMLRLAHFVVGLSLLVIVILTMCMICLENMRIGFRSSVGIFGTLFAFVIFSGAFFHMILYGYITSSKIFLTASATMFFVDIICIGVGCTAFDYTSYWMYAIVVVPGLAIYYPIYLGLPRLLSEFFFPIDERLDPNDFTWTTILIVILLPATVAELHILLDEDAIELAEDDYMFGGYLLLICLIDFPIRFLRKKGFLGEKEERDDEE